MKKTIGAAVINDMGRILAYTVKSTKQQCEEEAEKLFVDWKKLKKLGAKIIQVEIIALEE